MPRSGRGQLYLCSKTDNSFSGGSFRHYQTPQEASWRSIRSDDGDQAYSRPLIPRDLSIVGWIKRPVDREIDTYDSLRWKHRIELEPRAVGGGRLDVVRKAVQPYPPLRIVWAGTACMSSFVRFWPFLCLFWQFKSCWLSISAIAGLQKETGRFLAVSTYYRY